MIDLRPIVIAILDEYALSQDGIGTTPHASRLCTDEAKQAETINWAHGRASFIVVLDLVRNESSCHETANNEA